MKNQKIEKYFSDKENLNHALTHKSWVNEHKKTRENNERLEFLGDAVLEFVVSKELYLKLPKKEEGYLTVFLLLSNMPRQLGSKGFRGRKTE